MAYDLIVIGAGTAGLPATIFAARRGLKVALLEATSDIGGTLHHAAGQICAAGISLQSRRGIEDSPDRHFADCLALSQGKANAALIRRIVDEAPATVEWLLQCGLEPMADHPVTGEAIGRAGYSVPRYLWAETAGRAILQVLRSELERELIHGLITLQLNSPVVGLIEEQGSVVGVRTAAGELRGDCTLLASGGYARNASLFEALTGAPAYTASAAAHSLGDGLLLAATVGGAWRGHGLHRAGAGSILDSDCYPASILARAETVPQVRPPWEIWIDDSAQRFVREDEPSTYVRERAVATRPSLRYHIVFDQTILDIASPLVPGWSSDQLRSHFGSHPFFTQADRLEHLAEKLSMDASRLRSTVDQYNQAVDSGTDPLGRRYLPRRIEQAPFYAVTQLGHSATSAVGVVVNDQLEVLRSDGSVVPGLRAAGEVLGSGATVGDAFVPGMMLTPALSLGRWLGRTFTPSASGLGSGGTRQVPPV